MEYESIEFPTIEEARNYASQGGKYLVLAPEILQQIENAEEAGGFPGGMTGNASGFPYSALGNDASSGMSDASDPEWIDLEGAWVLPTIDDTVETLMSIRDVVTTWMGEITGPILLVPRKELNRWVGRPDPDDGA